MLLTYHYMLEQPFLNLRKEGIFRYTVGDLKEKELQPNSFKVLIYNAGSYQATF